MSDPRSVDIERIRVAAERDARDAVERDIGAAPNLPQDVAQRRRALLASGLFLTDTMAPEAYAAGRDAMAWLGIDDNLELFQSNKHGFDSARLVLYGNPIGIEFIGGYLSSLDAGGLLAVLGHEIGHAIAHSGNPRWARAFSAAQGGGTASKRTYSMAAELTADRFGLLACRDLDAVLRLEMQAAAGSSAKSIHLDTAAYLAQCRVVAEEILAQRGTAFGQTHPEHYVRAYAEWLFSETDVYASITGLGPGSRSLDEVDQTLGRLLGLGSPIPRTTSPRTPVAESPVAEPAAKPVRPQRSFEGLAADILTDGARRKLAETGKALATAARAMRDHLVGTEADDAPPEPEDASDPLEDDRRELLARFEELEKRAKDE